MDNNKFYPPGYPPTGVMRVPIQQQYIHNPTPTQYIPQAPVQQQYTQNLPNYTTTNNQQYVQNPISNYIPQNPNTQTLYPKPYTVTPPNTSYIINPAIQPYSVVPQSTPNYVTTNYYPNSNIVYYPQTNPPVSNITYQIPIQTTYVMPPQYTNQVIHTLSDTSRPIYYASPQTTIYSTPIDYVTTTTITTNYT